MAENNQTVNVRQMDHIMIYLKRDPDGLHLSLTNC
jgi:hypothetical protein